MTDLTAACANLQHFFDKAVQLDESTAGTQRHTLRLPLTRFAAAQLRMRLIPAALGEAAAGQPVHIALFGATNTGKSTLVNLLLGRAAAGMDVRARYSQHPEAYRPAPAAPEPTGDGAAGDHESDLWLSGPGDRFGGYRIHHGERAPRYSDAQLAAGEYQPALSLFGAEGPAGQALAEPAVHSAVLWDLPDFSTEESRSYFPSVLDVIALADLVLMTVTSESYADDRSVALLGMVHQAGSRLIVVSNKTAPHHDLIEDIRAKMAANAPAAEVFFLPHAEGDSPGQRLRALLASPESALLRSAVAGAAADGPGLRRRSLVGALAFLDQYFDTILAPLEREARLAQEWRLFAAETTEQEFLRRYRRDYLDNETYGEFRETLLRVMAQLGIPGVSAVVRGVGEVARIPLRLVKNWLLGPPTEKEPLEHKVLQELFIRWHAALKEEAQRQAQANQHPDWQTLARELDSDAALNRLRAHFAEAYEAYRAEMRQEIDRRSREILAQLQEKPKLVGALKGFRLSTDLLTTGMAVASHGLDPSDMILAPAVAAITDWLWELLGQYYVEDQRRRLQLFQFDRLSRMVEEALMNPVIALFPATVTAADLDRVRADFQAVRAAAARQAEA